MLSSREGGSQIKLARLRVCFRRTNRAHSTVADRVRAGKEVRWWACVSQGGKGVRTLLLSVVAVGRLLKFWLVAEKRRLTRSRQETPRV